MYIYKLTNIITNKVYIGKTTVIIERRIKRHFNEAKKGSTLYLHSAIRKYGIKNFKVEQIDTANTLEELSKKEKYWIEYYKSYDKKFGYNLTKGGEGGALTGDALERMKKSKKGKPHSEKQKARGYDYLKGINKGEKNFWYGKKALNAGKTKEEFYGEKEAILIKKKQSESMKKAFLTSEKLKQQLQKYKDEYEKHPNYCKDCGKKIEYKPGYKHKYCKYCQKGAKNDKNS